MKMIASLHGKLLLAALACVLVAACAGPRGGPGEGATVAPAAATPAALPPPAMAAPAPTAAAEPISNPADIAAPAEAAATVRGIAVGEPYPGNRPGPSGELGGDLSCKTSADCQIKDIGSCCGVQPRCLNVNAQTFPERVRAKCAKDGRASTCGMLAITGCECVAGNCSGVLLSETSAAGKSDPLR